jgi:hypothetical protein
MQAGAHEPARKPALIAAESTAGAPAELKSLRSQAA